VVLYARKRAKGNYHIVAPGLDRDRFSATLKGALMGLAPGVISDCLDAFKLPATKSRGVALERLNFLVGEDATLHLPEGPLFLG